MKRKKKKTQTHTNKFRHPSRTYVAFVKIRGQKEGKKMLFSFKEVLMETEMENSNKYYII